MIINIDASTYNGRIQIGKQGENLTTSVVFDCNAWLSDLDGGTLSIVHQRNSDPDAYPCGDYELDGKVLTWHINETDVAYCGIGACELRYTIGERIAKSKTFVTQTMKGLDPNETPPEAWEPYIDRVIDAATQEMENMTVSASATQGEETSASVTKTRVNDHENLAFSFVVEKGDKGDPGEDGKSIVNATASIDANVGTPSVTVTTSSSDEGLSVNLAFHNMKGIPGTSFDTSYLPSDTATGNPATFPDGAKNVPVDELTAEIVAAQDLHGYSNPWPAGGGKNKGELSTNSDASYFTVTKYEADDIEVTNNFTSSKFGACFQFNSVSGTTYRFTFSRCTIDGVDGAARLYLYSNSLWGNKITDFQVRADTKEATWESTYTGQIKVGMYVGAGKTVTLEEFEISIASETVTVWEPYSNICPIVGYSAADITHNGETDTIPFGQTVYGGSLNVTTGVLTIDRSFVSDLGDLTWDIYNSTYPTIYRASISGIYYPTANSERNKFFACSYLPPSDDSHVGISAGSNNSMLNMSMLSYAGQIYARNDDINNDADKFTNFIDGAELVFRLATPVTIQLTPDEVRTVLGNNSISSDLGGDVTVIYRADIGKYIDKKLS